MGNDVGGRIIAAFALGQRQKLQQEQFQQEQEDRQLQREMLMHQKKRLDIEEKLAQRAAQLQSAQFLEGRKGPVMEPSPEAAAPQAATPATVGGIQLNASPLPGLQPQELPHPTTMLAAVPQYGIPETPYTPRNEEQTQEAKFRDVMMQAAADRMKAQYGPQKVETLAPGTGLFRQGTGEVILKPERVPVPGVDVPFPTAVADQKAAIAKAGKTTLTPGAQADDAKLIAQAIINGEQPPDLKGMYRFGVPVRAELARQGFDLTTAQRDWQAITKHISTLNGQQQERLRQAITFTFDSLDIIDGLYKEWQATGLPTGFSDFNSAALATASRLPGKSGEVARALQAQINDLVSEMATVYKGGNSSTDEGLRLAAANLHANWNPQTFNRAMGLLRKNLQIRKNSIMTSQPVGVSSGSPYLGGQSPAPEGAAGPPAGAVGIAPGSDGKRYYHDAQGNPLGVAP